MKKKLMYQVFPISFFTLLIISIFSSTIFAAVPIEQQAKLWSDLVEAKANPSASKLGKWNVLEDMVLIKKVDGVSIKAAALATIIGYYDRKEHIWFGDEQLNEAMKNWSPGKKALMEDMVEKNGEKFMKHFAELEAESPLSRKRSETRHKDAFTYGVDMSRVIEENYLQRNGNDITRAARNFAVKRGLDVEVIARDNFRFDELVNFIDNNNPVIMQQSVTGNKLSKYIGLTEDNYLICVGYIRRGTEEYLITADLNKIIFDEVSHADFGKSKEKGRIPSDAGRKLQEKLKEMDKQFGLQKGDKTVNLTRDMPTGIEIMDYRPGNYTAYVIRDFKVTEVSYEKYLEYIKASYEISVEPSYRETEFKTQASKWIPLGTSVSDAERIMKGKKFDCRRYNEKATDTYPAYEVLSCERYGLEVMGARQRWNVYFKIKDEKISETGAYSGGYSY